MRPSCTCNALPVRGKPCPHVVYTCEKLDVPLATQLPVEDSRARWLEQIRVAGQVYKPETADVEEFMVADEHLEATGQTFDSRQLKIPYAPPKRYGRGNISKLTKIQKRMDAAKKMAHAKASVESGKGDGPASPAKGGAKRPLANGSNGTGLKRKRAPGIGGSGSGSGSAHGADLGAKRKASSGSDGGGGSPKKTTKKMKQPDKRVGA